MPLSSFSKRSNLNVYFPFRNCHQPPLAKFPSCWKVNPAIQGLPEWGWMIISAFCLVTNPACLVFRSILGQVTSKHFSCLSLSSQVNKWAVHCHWIVSVHRKLCFTLSPPRCVVGFNCSVFFYRQTIWNNILCWISSIPLSFFATWGARTGLVYLYTQVLKWIPAA